MEKEFLSYNQQMKRLRDKSILCKGAHDKTLLVRAGYFNLINGYKDPFICKIDSTGKHIYLDNCDIEHFQKLKTFDDELRCILLKYITKVEEEIRTLTGYKIDQCNGNGKIPWYDAKAYSDKKKLQDKMKAISSAYKELSVSKLNYVRFYMNNHSSIPTWIMVKVVNFATFIDILRVSKIPVLHSLCHLYGIYDKNGYCNVKLLIGSLHWLRKVRNSCAHNERIYNLQETFSKGKYNTTGRIKEIYLSQLNSSYVLSDSGKRIIDLLVYLKYYLPPKEYKRLINIIINLMSNLKNAVPPVAFDNICISMGIHNFTDIEKLKELSKDEIKYNKFDTLM